MQRLPNSSWMSVLGASVALAAATCTAAAADSPHAYAKPVVAITHHSGEFNGVHLKYSAIESQAYIAGADGKPAAVMVTTAYIREDVPGDRRRPVMFIFNGGPGASSSPLHTRALGVMHTVEANGVRQLGPNPYSPIDAADLVFIDPIGT